MERKIFMKKEKQYNNFEQASIFDSDVTTSPNIGDKKINQLFLFYRSKWSIA